MRNRTWLSVMLAVLIAAIAGEISAATFVVPTDDELVRKSKAIVVGTVDSVTAQATPEGGIQTVVTLTVEEPIKGPLAANGKFSLAEPGGVIGTRGLIVPGSPKFTVGDRVLLFLDRDKHQQWTTQDLVVGKFKFERDSSGRNVLAREAGEVDGWDQNGQPHVEKKRDAASFLDFVRNRAQGKPATENYVVQSTTTDTTTTTTTTSGTSAATTYPASAYLSTIAMNGVTHGVRWPGFGSGILFYNRNTQPGAPSGGIPAIQAGLAAWTNDCGSTVVYSYGGTNANAQGNNSMDGINGVLFEDPFGEIAGSFTGSGTLAVGAYWVNGSTNTLGGETLYSIVEGNVVVQDNIEIWPGVADQRFNQLLAHELGHTLGFRHSDESGRTPNTTVAVMRASLVDSYGANLQQYDIDAVRTVYSGGTCASPIAVTSISPTSGAAAGGTVITINGSGFVSGATVTFGAKSATGVTFVSSSQLRATAPSFAAGTFATVYVHNPNGTSASLANAYYADFADVPTTSSYHNVVMIAVKNAVMTGCGGSNFCPTTVVPRSDMAKFVEKGKHGSTWVPPAAVGIFSDVLRTDPSAPWIEASYNESITGGCATNPLRYCPTGSITRGQMAVFLLRAEHGSTYVPPTPTGIFADMPLSSGYTKWAEQVYREGITAGCSTSPLQYCPGTTVTRGQMAAFLVTTFNLH